jgi:hypothetical protein
VILTLSRQSHESGTVGRLARGGLFLCYTLEPQTPIPAGTYQVVITRSQRFQRDLPILLNVPGHTGIRIHAGNTTADTQGCILVGKGKAPASVTQSRLALAQVMRVIQSSPEPVWLTIQEPA